MMHPSMDGAMVDDGQLPAMKQGAVVDPGGVAPTDHAPLAAPGHIERLIAAVSRQDPVAFRELYDLTSSRLLGVILRICRDRDVAEDVLQEVYLLVWRRSELYDAAGGAGMAWLTIVARRRALDMVRSLGRHTRRVEHVDDDVLANFPDLIEPPGQSDDLRRLLSCMAHLDDIHRRAILLAYYEGWSREELSVHFDRPEGTIKTWLRRSLIALRACMDRG
jgi:RNA polymerase sigma-70 factor (ECF subfamily)